MLNARSGKTSGEETNAGERSAGAPGDTPRRREMDERIRDFNWSATPLGPIGEWPQSLRTVVDILLSSRYAMWMCWGEAKTMIYNDAYQPTLGIKHPRALGMPAKEVWAEIWPEIGPRIETVLTTGHSTYDEGLLLFLERSGFPEETYHTFSYSPLRDDHGAISGMLCVVTEETERLIGERRVETLRDVASALANTRTEAEVETELCDQLKLNRKDLPFTLLYVFDEKGGARRACSTGLPEGHPLAQERIEAGNDWPWPAQSVYADFSARLIGNLMEPRIVAPVSSGTWAERVTQAALVPVRGQGQERPAGFFVVGTNPYRRYDTDYSGFVNLLAGQIAAALSNARAYEAERLRAEALAEINRAKTTFFSNVSHELRTPLTLMLSPVEELLARSEERQSPADRDLLEFVHRNGLRLQKLVNTLLDFTRLEAGRIEAVYEPVDLSRSTAELAANFESAMARAGLGFHIDCQPLPEPVIVDPEMWEKIVLNLLSNAVKFTIAGSVSVTVRHRGPVAELRVRDTGIGIPEEELPHVFERFHRGQRATGRSIEGTGIGLALVQELVHLHGGTVVAESRPGEGTAFTVTIPFGTEHLPKDKLLSKDKLRDATEAPAISRPGPASAPFLEEALRWLPRDGAPTGDNMPAGAETILLADDNPDMRDYVTRLLSGRYRVVAVADGETALRTALTNSPDLILSDVMMPGLNGFELLKNLRSHPETRTIPVVMLSARAGEESRVEGLDAGADDYLIKPFTAKELLARVGAHLAMRRRTREADQALRDMQVTLQSFYDSSPFLMGVAEVVNDRIEAVYCNQATAEFFGAPQGSIEGSSSSQLGISRDVDEIWLRYYRQSQTEGQAVRFEYEHPGRNGNFWMSACVNYLGDGPTGWPRFSYIAEDATERKRKDAELQQSNNELRRANVDLEQFAYSASHDLQEPLRQVAVYSQLLGKLYGDKLDGKAAEYLGYCIEGAHRMEMLISGLLAFSQAARKSEAPPEPVRLDEVIATVRQNLAAAIEETGADVTTGELPVIFGDPVPLVLVFQNLLSNALKYRQGVPRVRIESRAEDGHWLLSVADNGIGIAKEFQTQIFGMFRRLHKRSEYPGTGIGLAICQKVVERYGGRIWMESEPGRGTTCFFTLPRVMR